MVHPTPTACGSLRERRAAGNESRFHGPVVKSLASWLVGKLLI
jgi:hypothetical protein